jgi:cytochrome P450
MSGQVGPVMLDGEFTQDSNGVLARMRDQPPVLVRFPDGEEGWLLTRYEDVKIAASDPRISHDLDGLVKLEQLRGAAESGVSATDPEAEYRWMFRQVLYMDPPDHARLRKLVNKAFVPRVIEQSRLRIEEVADGLLDRMTGRGNVELVSAYAVPLPLTVICEQLGIPEEDRTDFQNWARVLMGGSPEQRPAVLPAVADYLRSLIERKRASPGTDLVSRMIAASEDDDRLSWQELISMTLSLLIAGHDTTVHMIANGTLAFLQSPGQLALLRSDPSLLPNAVEEILRYGSPVNVTSARFTLEPIVLGGVHIPAGEILYVSFLSANRDPRYFSDPDKFDITRDTRGHLGFGHGIHYCVGAPLARLEGSIGRSRLLDRFPEMRLAVAPQTLAYRDSAVVHGLEELPVYL